MRPRRWSPNEDSFFCFREIYNGYYEEMDSSIGKSGREHCRLSVRIRFRLFYLLLKTIRKVLEKMNFIQNSKRFLNKNASTILTYAGAAGVVATTVLAVKATPKALKSIETAKDEKGEQLTKFEVVKCAAPAYIPTIITGTATIACVFGANILNKRTQAALMSAYALLDNSYKEYRNKVTELYGEDADVQVKEEIAKDKYKETNIELSDGKQLYFDDYSGRYFEATSETLIRAENTINRRLSETDGAYLNEFYELLGLETTDYGDYLGWSSCEMYETCWSSWLYFYHKKVILDDGLECTIISFSMDPTFDFENYY